MYGHGCTYRLAPHSCVIIIYIGYSVATRGAHYGIFYDCLRRRELCYNRPLDEAINTKVDTEPWLRPHVLLRVQRAFTALGFPAGALDIYPASLKLNPVK